MHDIYRLLQQIHELDRRMGQENHGLSENVQIIRDELYDLSEYVTHSLGRTRDGHRRGTARAFGCFP